MGIGPYSTITDILIKGDQRPQGAWPRWQVGKTLSSPPLTGTMKLQLFKGQLLMRKPGIYQKRSSTLKDIKERRDRNKRVGQVESQYNQDHGIIKIIDPGGQSVGENNYHCKGSLQGIRGLKTTLDSLAQGTASGR